MKRFARAQSLATDLRRPLALRPGNSGGFTVAEVMIAAAIGGCAFVGAMELNSQLFLLAKSTRETNAASLCLQERSEQLRNASWAQLTTASFLTSSFLASAPANSASLANFKETVALEAYPDPKTDCSILVEKQSDSAPATLIDGTKLPSEKLARVELTISWVGGGRIRTRSSATIVSNSGVSRPNLQGSIVGADPFPSSDPTTPTSTPSDPIVSPPPATPVPVSASGNSNGQGGSRGTIGSQNGKK